MDGLWKPFWENPRSGSWFLEVFWAPKSVQEIEKSVSIFRSFSDRPFFSISMHFGDFKGAKSTEKRSETETGDFVKIRVSCRRQHDFGGSEAPQIEENSIRKGQEIKHGTNY